MTTTELLAENRRLSQALEITLGELKKSVMGALRRNMLEAQRMASEAGARAERAEVALAEARRENEQLLHALRSLPERDATRELTKARGLLKRGLQFSGTCEWAETEHRKQVRAFLADQPIPRCMCGETADCQPAPEPCTFVQSSEEHRGDVCALCHQPKSAHCPGIERCTDRHCKEHP